MTIDAIFCQERLHGLPKVFGSGRLIGKNDYQNEHDRERTAEAR